MSRSSFLLCLCVALAYPWSGSRAAQPDEGWARPQAFPTVATEAVSARRLQHKVPRGAWREFNQGRADLRKGRANEAADHLNTAVTIDPEFADAHNDLGVTYFRLGDYERSIEHMRKAIELDPGHQPATNNLCVLLLKTKRYAEGGQVADRLLKRGASSAILHYTAAASLIAEHGSMSLALYHLRKAQDDIPKVRLVIAYFLQESGRREEAVHEIETYLRTENENRPEAVEAWLNDLRK